MELLLPELGENITQGTVTKILVKPGDTVKKGQSILELETDKAVLEVPSPEEGLIKEILIKNGGVIKVGQAIFKMESVILTPPKTGEESKTKNVGTPRPVVNESRGGQDDQKESEQLTLSKPTTVEAMPVSIHMPVRKDVAASPSVRLFAREIGVDIGQVPSSGPAGRISIDDVKKYAKMLLTSPGRGMGAPIAQQPLPDFAKWGSIRREPMNNVRRKTAEHVSSAWTTIPHVTQFDKADMTELEKLRKQASSKAKKLSITPFLIKIVAAALKKFPPLNASVDSATNEIIYKDYINIGVAVDTDRGLLVPVLKNVDRLTVHQIADELTAMAERARTRKTTIEEMQGGCFTISNLGGIGGAFFTPIVNWPEVAILGVSRAVMEQVYVDGPRQGSGGAGQFIPRLILPLSLSYDHRLIDGSDGARFIRFVCETLEKPLEIH